MHSSEETENIKMFFHYQHSFIISKVRFVILTNNVSDNSNLQKHFLCLCKIPMAININLIFKKLYTGNSRLTIIIEPWHMVGIIRVESESTCMTGSKVKAFFMAVNATNIKWMPEVIN